MQRDEKTNLHINLPKKYAKNEPISQETTIEGLRAKRAYIAFLADFHFLQDRADFW